MPACAVLAASLLHGAVRAEVTAPAYEVDARDLVRRVVRSQRRVEAAFDGATFDQREVKIEWGADGRAKEIASRLFYVLSGNGGEEGSRELVEVDGRPATEAEKRKAAEEDEKSRKKRVEQKAAAEARRVEKVSGDEEDPLVGKKRLSELIGRFDIRVVGEEIVEGRPAYVLDFSPNPSAPAAKTLGDRALNALAGRAVIDAVDFQVRSVVAHLTKPVKVAGGLAANVKTAEIAYTGQPLGGNMWFPCVVEFRLTGKTALFFRLDTSFRFEFGNLETVSRGNRKRRSPRREPRERSMTPSRRRAVLLGALALLAAGFAWAYWLSLMPATHPDHDHGILNLDAGGRLERHDAGGKDPQPRRPAGEGARRPLLLDVDAGSGRGAGGHLPHAGRTEGGSRRGIRPHRARPRLRDGGRVAEGRRGSSRPSRRRSSSTPRATRRRS